MRILLDENLDWRLGRDLPGHRVESVPLLGWAGISNGELLAKAVETGFDAEQWMIICLSTKHRAACHSVIAAAGQGRIG
jgi:hypothetical protein